MRGGRKHYLRGFQGEAKHSKYMLLAYLNLIYFIQSNLSTVDILYSGHLVIADRFSRNPPNPGQTLLANPASSEQFYSGYSL